MKKFSILFLIFLFSLSARAEKNLNMEEKHRLVEDSLNATNTNKKSTEEYKKNLPRLIDKAVEEEKIKNEKESSESIPNWKFYTILLAFPVFLILLFVLVFIRGKRAK